MSNDDAYSPNQLDSLKKIVSDILKDTKKDVVKFKLTDDSVTIFDSKIGGVPYCPKYGHLPIDSEGRQLRLLAQINLSQLPANSILPANGMLQFFILNDDSYGINIDNPTTNDTWRVIYYDTIDMDVDEYDIIEELNPYSDDTDSSFPVMSEIGLQFFLDSEGVTIGDYEFNELFLPRAHEIDSSISSVYDLPEDLIFSAYNIDEDNKDFVGMGHKLGGYPGFTQTDPRELDNSLKSYDTLLFQLDSDSYGDDVDAILWGDRGICNFFISKTDLSNNDFSNVLYNWDCC